MPILDYCWSFSTISKATLQASSSYQLVNFTPQADQTSPILMWKDSPQRAGTQRPKYADYGVNADLSQSGHGFWQAIWCMMPMTELQFAYIDTNQFSSGTLESAPCTIQTWDDYVHGFSCYQFTVARPIPGQDYEIMEMMYMNVKYRFSGGVKL